MRRLAAALLPVDKDEEVEEEEEKSDEEAGSGVSSSEGEEVCDVVFTVTQTCPILWPTQRLFAQSRSFAA